MISFKILAESKKARTMIDSDSGGGHVAPAGTVIGLVKATGLVLTNREHFPKPAEPRPSMETQCFSASIHLVIHLHR